MQASQPPGYGQHQHQPSHSWNKPNPMAGPAIGHPGAPNQWQPQQPAVAGPPQQNMMPNGPMGVVQPQAPLQPERKHGNCIYEMCFQTCRCMKSACGGVVDACQCFACFITDIVTCPLWGTVTCVNATHHACCGTRIWGTNCRPGGSKWGQRFSRRNTGV